MCTWVWRHPRLRWQTGKRATDERPHGQALDVARAHGLAVPVCSCCLCFSRVWELDVRHAGALRLPVPPRPHHYLHRIRTDVEVCRCSDTVA